MEFCLKLRGSEACVLEDLAKAIDLVHVRRNLVESGHALLNHAHRAQQEYDRYNHLILFSFVMRHIYFPFANVARVHLGCIYILDRIGLRLDYMGNVTIYLSL